jgi:hypothetical protein
MKTYIITISLSISPTAHGNLQSPLTLRAEVLSWLADLGADVLGLSLTEAHNPIQIQEGRDSKS